jgi:hypothetical protein
VKQKQPEAGRCCSVVGGAQERRSECDQHTARVTLRWAVDESRTSKSIRGQGCLLEGIRNTMTYFWFWPKGPTDLGLQQGRGVPVKGYMSGGWVPQGRKATFVWD